MFSRSDADRRRTLAAPLAALVLTVAGGAFAQRRGAESPAAPVGTPSHIGSFEPVADVRAFALAEGPGRILVAYISGDARLRGAVRTAVLRSAASGGGGLERVGTDSVFDRPAVAVGAWWDGTRGAVVYVVPRPHRGEDAEHRRRRIRGGGNRTPVDPLGASTLTAGDVMLQRIDAQGAAVGRPVLVFEENARTFRVAVAPDRDGWLVAWTGAINSDDVVVGTVRTMRIDAAGVARSYASDTGFVGQVGDVLSILPAVDGNHGARLVFTGERCTARADLGAWPAVHGDPSAEIERRERQLPGQNPPRELDGPRVLCGPIALFTAQVMPNGTTRAIASGPALATDAAAVHSTRANAHAVVASVTQSSEPRALLARLVLDGDGGFAAPRALTPDVSDSRRAPPAPAGGGGNPSVGGGCSPGAAVIPSTVAPPRTLDAADLLRTPSALAVANRGSSLVVAALSPTRTRVALAAVGDSAGGGSTVLLAPGSRQYDLSLARVDPGGAWLFVQTGSATGGALYAIDTATASARAMGPDVPWVGDERFRVLLLRVLAARAANTSYEASYGPMSERPENAGNPALPGMAAALRRLRARWEAACEPLWERTRQLVRTGSVSTDLSTFVREVCEVPPVNTGPAPGGESNPPP